MYEGVYSIMEAGARVDEDGESAIKKNNQLLHW